MLANLNLHGELNAFATRLIQMGHSGIEAKLVIENGQHQFSFLVNLDTPAGSLLALLSYGYFDTSNSHLLKYAERLLGFCYPVDSWDDRA